MDQWLFVKNSQTWFPRYGHDQSALMDLTFHAPRRYRLASVGELVDTHEDGDVMTTHWVTAQPTDQACFNLGEFNELKITDPRIPPVTVQMNTVAHHKLDQMFMGQADPQQDVAADVANSLAFFSRVFGGPLEKQYYATEIPFPYGQAFPGLMYLSLWTFETLNENGGEETFRAHEMAHQWWGIGWRVAQTDHPDDYSLIIYEKGAWVLQMLRNLMLNLHTMDEAAFTATMQDFYARYRGRRASTADFQRVVEEHTGFSMDWIFDEWVNGTAIPTYTLSWTTERAPDSTITLRLRVRQEGVGPTFKVPAVPVRLELNPLASVLAEVKTERWSP